MGILNVTPDSFYDGGQYEAIDTVVKRAEEIYDTEERRIGTVFHGTGSGKSIDSSRI